MTETIVLLAILAVASIIDRRTRRLPDWLTLPLVALGLDVAAFHSPADLPWHTLGTMLGFLALWLVAHSYRRLRGVDGLGLGDAKLLAAVGAWLGPLYLAPVVFVSALFALVTVLLLRLSGRTISSQTVLPFGPFLSASFFLFWCFQLSGWTLF